MEEGGRKEEGKGKVKWKDGKRKGGGREREE